MDGALTDEQLMARIAAGDKQAFSQFVTRHLSRIMDFARRHLLNQADAEDVAQEAFTRLWLKAPQWQSRGLPPHSWLYRITYNLCIDTLRRQKPTASIDEHAHLAGAEKAEDRLLQASRKNAIDQALTSLPERQRTAIVLCSYHGLSNRDAGAIMEISVEALESLLSRARRTLRKLLLAQQETPS
jgi:RNA polymerase sigma-70 factor (ECF subfamily)